MRTQLWNNMANIKFKAIYLDECSRMADKVGRAYSLFLSFASASSVATWVVWEKMPLLWAAIVTIAQMFHLAKPYLLFMKNDKDFLEMSFEFESLYLEYERLWVAYDDGRLQGKEAEDRFYALREKEAGIEKAHKQLHCPRLNRLIIKAELQAKAALALNFTTEEMKDDDEDTNSAPKTDTEARPRKGKNVGA